MKLSEKIQEALREQQEINLSDPAVQKRLAAQWGYVPAEAQPKKVHAVVCFYGLHYYVSALFFDPTSAIARCRKEINNSAYPDSWEVVEFEIEDTLDNVQLESSVPDGWKEAAIAWEVCASIHREYGKGKDPFFNTRQGDFVKHANDARAMLSEAPEAKP